MKLYELKIQDDTDEIFAISLVESPAIESDFIYFGKEEIHFASVDTEQRLILGPILIADKPILRVDGEGQPYHVFLKKETVKQLAQNYLKSKYTDKATLEHGKSIKGVDLVESWIKEGSFDKSNKYGLNLPDGTWVGVFSVDKSPEGEKIWNDYVKTGKVKGFSIEGTFTHDLVHASKVEIDKDIDEMTEVEAEIFLSTLRALIKTDNRFKSKKKVEMESYSDYGDSVRNNAKKVLEFVNKNGWGSCGTPVGKIRANQLANGEPISIETIKRMYSYLSRHEVDLESSKTYSDGCGKLMYDSWGGKTALGWSRNKLRELGVLVESEQPSISSSYPGEVAKVKKKKDDTK